MKSVIEIGTVTPIPRAPAWISGITALRSQALTVIDCRRAIGLGTGSGGVEADWPTDHRAAVVAEGWSPAVLEREQWRPRSSRPPARSPGSRAPSRRLRRDWRGRRCGVGLRCRPGRQQQMPHWLAKCLKLQRRFIGQQRALRHEAPAARLVTPQLTTIDQDANLAGRMLVSKLIDKGDGPAISQRLETSLLIRESCGG